ncbi:hypothetical protein OPV22_012879 [Ensete ventricosum]|uniref:Uncharacterized protein n=1 Tax=Ensete ventricosum TaxID=4639 RepID=A0AAV8R632_ENSVE|nr:hypothetical protein OPV22_012879 [Ensete ventricosum]
MIKGELEGTNNQLLLLEKMNQRVAKEYNGYGDVASGLRVFVEKLCEKNHGFEESRRKAINGVGLKIERGRRRAWETPGIISKRFLTIISQVAASLGVDLSQASISVQISLSRCAIRRPTGPNMLNTKDYNGQSPILRDATPENESEEFEQARKRRKRKDRRLTLPRSNPMTVTVDMPVPSAVPITVAFPFARLPRRVVPLRFLAPAPPRFCITLGLPIRFRLRPILLLIARFYPLHRIFAFARLLFNSPPRPHSRI